MRIALRIVLVLVALVLAGLAALAVALPRIVKSDAVRARVEGAAESALGREVRYGELDFALLPPSLVVREPSVAGESADAPPLVEAESIALRVALAPLLTRTVVIDSLVVEGASLRLVRTREGIVLPQRKAGAGDEEPEEAGASPVALAVRGLALRNTTLVLEDRSVSPTVTWELRAVDAEARGESLDAPIDFEARGELASGGRLEVKGQATLGGALDSELRLDAVTVAPLRPYLAAARELSGALSGTLRAAGPAEGIENVAAKLELRDGRVALADLDLRGRLAVTAELRGGLSALAGPFEVDATDADLRYGESFHKPSGREATLRGRLVMLADGRLNIDDAALRVDKLRAAGSLRTGTRTQLTANVAPFDLTGWGEMVPALASRRLSGELAIGELRAATNPLELHATIPLDGLRAEHPEAGPVALRGAVVANGQTIETRDVSLVAADQTVRVDATVRDLATTPRFQVTTRTEKADTNRLVSAFTTRRDTFFGLLDLNGTLSGRAGDDLVRSLRGTSQIDIRDGRIVGLSILEATFDAMVGQGSGKLAGVGLNLANALTGNRFSRYYEDDFESLTGTLQLADGVASTNDLRLVYGEYRVNLTGRVGLEDGLYEMTGTITLGPEVEAALTAEFEGGADPAGKPPVIPIALRGDLGKPFGLKQGNPRLAVTPEVAQAFANRYALVRYQKKIDEQLGPGASDAIRGVLDAIGGGQRKQAN